MKSFLKKISGNVDMLNGALMPSLWRFAVPIMVISVVQLLFHTADMIVAGHFVGDRALAAIGTTSSLSHLFLYVYTGIAVGVNVVVAKDYGAGDSRGISRAIHTSLPVAVVIGLLCAVVGFFICPSVLRLMQVPKDILPDAIFYIRLCFLGAVPTAIYHCCAAVLRANGDSMRPMYFLMISGVINVVLNVIFVTVFRMEVAGLAIATVVSQFISAALAWISLCKRSDAFSISFSKLRLDLPKTVELIRYGLPSALQKMCYAFCNLFIQSKINLFGTAMMAGDTAAANVESFVLVCLQAWSDVIIPFVGQNAGAKNARRCKKILKICLISVIGVGVVMGVSFYLLRVPLLSLYTDSTETVAYGAMQMFYVCLPYAIYGIVTVICGFLQGMGYPMIAMIANLIGICGIRILWLTTVFERRPTPHTLYLSYPVSWTVTVLVVAVLAVFCYRAFQKKIEAEKVC